MSSSDSKKWLVPAAAAALLVFGGGAVVYFLARGRKPAEPTVRCTPENCATPFQCQGSPAECQINPANRRSGETFPVPQDSNAARMLLHLSASTAQWLSSDDTVMYETFNVFGTPAPIWNIYQDGTPVEWEVLEWSYDPANGDVIDVLLIDNDNVEMMVRYRWLSADGFEETIEGSAARAFRRTTNYCGSVNCAAPFLCQGSPAQCLINPANRKPGETDPVPVNSNAARMLALLSTQAQWIDSSEA